MLYWLIEISDKVPAFNALRYITGRTGGAVVTALVFVLAFGLPIMRRLDQGPLRPIGADRSSSRSVPGTMGGLVIVSAVLISIVLWANPSNPYVWIVLGVTIGFGLIGLHDDYRKVADPRHDSSSDRTRLAIEAAIALAASIAIFEIARVPLPTSLAFPLFNGLAVDLGRLPLALCAVVMVAAANVVKLTVALGRPVIISVIVAAEILGVLAYLGGNIVFASYFQIHYVAGAGELSVPSGAAVGAGVGFLWLSASRGSIPMGDTGSLALGAMIGAIAVAI
jgi:phospho-N-acetylmuramoyl-pentapeptide-transferase